MHRLPLLALLAASRTLSYTLDIVNQEIAPDGIQRQAVLATDGGQPRGGIGPLITYNMGDTFDVTVNNRLTDPTMRRSTSIHWHGFFQNEHAAQDGAAFVSQCPISPNATFRYNFPIRDHAGTFWYHSHLSTQYCDGLRGPIVIYDPNDPYKNEYDVDDETTVISLTDHYHEPAPKIQKDWFAAGGGPPPPPQSVLLNGVGQCNSTNSGVDCKSAAETQWPVLKVKKGTRYRLRFINMACDLGMRVSIQNHTMDIIESDSQGTQRLKVEYFDIFPGQRFSAILNADKFPANYWVFVQPIGDPNLPPARGILSYEHAKFPPSPKVQPPANLTRFREEELRYLPKPGEQPIPFVPEEINWLNVTIGLVNGSSFFNVNVQSDHGSMNGTFFAPSVPALLQVINGARDPGDFIPSENLIRLEKNKLYYVKFNKGPITHPMHLHGHTFEVLQSGGSTTVVTDNPVRRDVVAVADDTIIRFKTDNPGPWFLHCHIDWHLEAGLAIIFGEALEESGSQSEGQGIQVINEDWEALCPAYNDLSPDLQ